MTANYELPSVVEKRVRFFDGQFLQDQDFVDEQKYHLDRERRHLRMLHVAGIADGLAVSASASEPNKVTVAPGTAIDSDGRQLALAEARTVDLLPAGTFNDKQGVELYITYQESAVDVQTTKGSSDSTRWLERPKLEAIAPGGAYAGATPPVLLARVALDNAGRVTVDDTVRAYSGLRLPGPAADAPTLRSTAGGRVALSGSLTVDGNVGIGTTAPEQRLTVNGDLKFTDVATVWGAGRLHITGEELLYLLNKSGVVVGKEWGGTGSLTVEGDLQAASASVVNTLYVKGTLGIGITEPTAQLSIVGGASELMGEARSRLLRISGYSLGADLLSEVALSSTGLLLDDTYNVSLDVRAIRTSAKTATSFGPSTMGIALSMSMDNQAYYGPLLTLHAYSNVGINTLTPSAALSVVEKGRIELAGTAQSGAFRITGHALGADLLSEVALSSTGLVVDRADSVSLGVRAIRTTARTTSASGWSTMAIGLGMDVGDTVRRGAALFLHANGNIGIGVFTPSARLSLVEPYASELTGKAQAGLFRISGGALNTGAGSEVALTSTGLVVDKADSVSLGVRAIRTTAKTGTASSSSTTAIGLGMDVNDTARAGAALFLHGNGNVGIGTGTTTAPDKRLTVNGDLKFTDVATIWGAKRLHITGEEVLYLLNKSGVIVGNEWGGNGNLHVEGNFSQASDARLKKRIRRLERPLDRLTGVRGVSYLPRQVGGRDGRSEERPAIGVLAQEVEAVFPQLVSTPGGDGYKAVDYNGLTAVLLEAVKELKTALDALRERVAALQAHA